MAFRRFLEDCYIALNAINIILIFSVTLTTILNLNWNKKLYLPSLDVMILKPISLGWTYFLKNWYSKKFSISLITPDNAIIICTIVENRELWKKTFIKNSKSFISQLISIKFNSRGCSKCKKYPHWKIKGLKTKSHSNNLAFVTTFNSNNKNIFLLIQAIFKTLQKSYQTKQFSKILSQNDLV